MTAFTTADEALAKFAQEWEALGRNSFRNTEGETRTFLDPGELLTLFSNYEPLHYWEGIGPEHDHGHGVPERHAMTTRPCCGVRFTIYVLFGTTPARSGWCLPCRSARPVKQQARPRAVSRSRAREYI